MLLVISPAKTLDYAPAPADVPFTLPDFLQHSQQLALHFQRHIPDFIEKQRPALRQIEFPFLSFLRSA